MDEYNRYAAQADTIKIEDITSCETKRNILKRLKDNNAKLTQLWICNRDQVYDGLDYDFDSAEELAWLGYYLGQSTNVNHFHIRHSPPASYGVEVFRRGIGNNKSIKTLNVGGEFIFEGNVLPMLDTFLKNNSNLFEIVVEGGEFGAEGARQFSLALGGCSKSLKVLSIGESGIESGQLVDIITALSMHPQLTELYLSNVNIGRNESMALATLLRCTTTQLETLSLYDDDINDEGVEILVDAIANINTLQEMILGSNRSITLNGWKKLSTLLEAPSSNLKSLDVSPNNIGNEGALVFARALSSNSTLKTLDLFNSRITTEGWAPFSKLLCDTSSINNTYMSNHTLNKFGPTSQHNSTVTDDVRSLLALNRNDDKQQVAITKILQYHSHFDMQPFFKWEFKVLPIMIEWFAHAARRVTTYDKKVSRLRLSATFDFIKEFPMLYIEPVTRKEIIEYTAMEEALQGAEHQGQLEEIQRCKTRAMRRL